MRVLTRPSQGHAKPRAATAAPWLWAATAASALLTGGCYDAQALLEARRATHGASETEEIDLGAYRIKLPSPMGHAAGAVDFHAFGRVDKAELPIASAAIDDHTQKLRAQMLLTVRTLSSDQFEEPDLATLRQRISKVVNGVLKKSTVEDVGFYRFSFRSP